MDDDDDVLVTHAVLHIYNGCNFSLRLLRDQYPNGWISSLTNMQ